MFDTRSLTLDQLQNVRRSMNKVLSSAILAADTRALVEAQKAEVLAEIAVRVSGYLLIDGLLFRVTDDKPRTDYPDLLLVEEDDARRRVHTAGQDLALYQQARDDLAMLARLSFSTPAGQARMKASVQAIGRADQQAADDAAAAEIAEKLDRAGSGYDDVEITEGTEADYAITFTRKTRRGSEATRIEVNRATLVDLLTAIGQTL